MVSHDLTFCCHGPQAQLAVCRMEQDKFAVESHKKAAAAAAAGKFTEEIVPVQTTVIDPKTKETTPITVTADDGIRANSSVQSLSKLPPAFKKGGTTTAGNSSQVCFTFTLYAYSKADLNDLRCV